MQIMFQSRLYTSKDAQGDIGATHNIHKVNRVLLCCKLILIFVYWNCIPQLLISVPENLNCSEFMIVVDWRKY